MRYLLLSSQSFLRMLSGEKSAKMIKKDLRSVAKSVRIIVPTPDLEHGDISDFFKDHTVEDLEALLTEEPKKIFS